mmetsp:Transcript_14592/g.51920  ORF Transcript_14592/g.51920 Transcript_14592/m.51920 type:complete len:311 (+) Transcript_14592:515-1447(+)
MHSRPRRREPAFRIAVARNVQQGHRHPARRRPAERRPAGRHPAAGRHLAGRLGVGPRFLLGERFLFEDRVVRRRRRLGPRCVVVGAARRRVVARAGRRCAAVGTGGVVLRLVQQVAARVDRVEPAPRKRGARLGLGLVLDAVAALRGVAERDQLARVVVVGVGNVVAYAVEAVEGEDAAPRGLDFLGRALRRGVVLVRREHEQAQEDDDDGAAEARVHLAAKAFKLAEVNPARDDGKEDEVDLQKRHDEDGVVEAQRGVHTVEPDADERRPRNEADVREPVRKHVRGAALARDAHKDGEALGLDDGLRPE